MKKAAKYQMTLGVFGRLEGTLVDRECGGLLTDAKGFSVGFVPVDYLHGSREEGIARMREQAGRYKMAADYLESGADAWAKCDTFPSPEDVERYQLTEELARLTRPEHFGSFNDVVERLVRQHLAGLSIEELRGITVSQSHNSHDENIPF